MTSPTGRATTKLPSSPTQAAADLYRSLDAENQLAEVLAATALSYHFAGDSTSAEQVETEAQNLLKAVDDPMVAARSKLSLAGCRVLSGDLSRGLELLEEVAPVFVQSGDVWKLGDTHGGLAHILFALGDVHAARSRAVSALEIFLETGNTPLAVLVLQVVARIELAAGRPANAVSLIAASTRLGDPLSRSFTSTVLGTDLEQAIGEALASAEVEEAWSQGRSMTPDQVLAATAPDANT